MSLGTRSLKKAGSCTPQGVRGTSRSRGKGASRLPLIALLACVFALAIPASASADVEIEYPADGGAYSGQLSDFNGSASMNFFHYLVPLQVSAILSSEEPQTDLFGMYVVAVGQGEDSLDIDGDWHIPFSEVTDRRLNNPSDPPLPDGTPLADGKYHLRVTQYCASLHCIFDPNDSDNGNDTASFWIDTTMPETEIEITSPASGTPSNSSDWVFKITGRDPVPAGQEANDYEEASGVDYVDCRIDNEPFDHCILPGTDYFTVGSTSDGRDFDYEFNDTCDTFFYFCHGSSVPEGEHVFQAQSIDNAYNTDPTPASQTFLVDKTPPDITIDGPLPKQRFLLHDDVTPTFSCVDPLRGTPTRAPRASTPARRRRPTTRRSARTIHGHRHGQGGQHVDEVRRLHDRPPRLRQVRPRGPPARLLPPLEALGSSEMLDSSGNGHHGTYQNGVALGRDGATNCERRPHPPRACELAAPPLNDENHAPPENKAAYFGPRDKHAYVNNLTAPQTAYTMEAWVKPKTAENMMVMGHGSGGQLFISGGHLAFRQTQDTIYSSGPGRRGHPGRLEPRRRHLGRPHQPPLRQRRRGRNLDLRQQVPLGHLDLLRRLRRDGALVPRHPR